MVNCPFKAWGGNVFPWISQSCNKPIQTFHWVQMKAPECSEYKDCTPGLTMPWATFISGHRSVFIPLLCFLLAFINSHEDRMPYFPPSLNRVKPLMWVQMWEKINRSKTYLHPRDKAVGHVCQLNLMEQQKGSVRGFEISLQGFWRMRQNSLS